ncbi:Retrovirus-related Pol polyprotein from transposon TNT 1-94 [Gossypium australe]|uniref:Retrovirus-related Pol polyprotein from transposon TNT 1-94 n=1 Tax=Gossypium australe TaxID=47621 RepID=A0A5B6WES3_9ROSI|nr:Retrovirus-related Pol polyprotein from transposon TNT 1-94 [Gossypium australe]
MLLMCFLSIKDGLRIKVIVVRFDNGIEYTSQRFNTFYEEAGIEHQLIFPYFPQQNGVSERKNRTIIEMTRCILHEKSLPKELLTKVLEEKTPYEAWFKMKPTLKNLKVFDCLCFYHVPQVKKDNLGEKSEHGIYVSYSLVSKAYRIYQPQIGKMIVSGDV